MLARGEGDAKRNPPGLLACGVALLLGALLVQTLPHFPSRWCDAIALLGSLLISTVGRALPAGFMRIGGRCPPYNLTLLAIFVAAFGYTALRADLAMHARLPHALEGRDLVVTGTIKDLPQAQDESTRFDVDVARASLDGAAIPLHGNLRLSWYASRNGAAPELDPCSRWRLQVRLKRPRSLLNPGGLDFERSALQKRIVATGYVREDAANAQLSHSACVDGLRGRISNAIAAALPGDPHAARLLRALSVGDQSALDESDWQVVRATGVSHLIAISGFHVGLAAIFAALLVRLLWWLFPGLALRLPRPIAEAAIALPAAIAYGALAGFGLPTTRTLWMIGAVSLSRILRRGGGMGEGLALALCAILIVDPLSVLSAGFWLSFAGVVFLAWTLARGSGWRGHLRELGLSPLLMALALLPLTVWFFGQASLVGPLANLVAVPFISFVIVPMTLVASALLVTLPSLGVPLLHVCAWLADAQWWILEKLSALPIALHYFPQPTAIAFVLACIGVIWLLAPRGVPARALAPLLMLPLLWPRATPLRHGGFAAMVVDVGQGLSVLVRTRDHALLYDTGARYPSGFDLGEAAVVPALHAIGVDRLDTLIISHGDNDHAGGAQAVLAAFPVTHAFGGEPDRGNVPLKQCEAGQHWNWDGVDFRVLSPPAPVHVHGNDAGCVLLVSGTGGRLLLPADTTAKVEPAIAEAVLASSNLRDPPLVLVVPHHGSKTSSSEDYLRALRPRFAIASAGYRNRFGHPANVVVARYEQLGIPLSSTFDTGAVRIAFGANESPRIVSEERIEQRRYWREH
ncbi:MAG TPA: DNA internalization-related competence protein ComEC/Rec2 [Rhodanobacteraceae bacterium]|nr:DNA internalization-related competence protein ComEC/Rec2 [Rhodanobacteraceae bacterium]